jgi:nucleoside-diphosphate-sugar epimerase
VLSVIPTTGPQDDATSDLIHRLRDDTIPAATGGTGAEVRVGGITATSIDSTADLARRIPYLIIGVVVLSMLLLLVGFRSIAIALKAAAMNLLSVAAAYGVVALVLEGGRAGRLVGIGTATPLPPFVPVLMFAAWQYVRTYRGPTTLTTVRPGAVFGPVLSADNLGSVQVIGRLMSGGMPAMPRLGFEVVDVRDLADVHLRAMLAPEAAGERFIAVGEFVWMSEAAEILRSRLPAAAAKVPTRNLPDPLFRLAAVFDRSLRSVRPALGRKHRHSPAKAERLLEFQPRPAAETIVDTAESLLAHGVG